MKQTFTLLLVLFIFLVSANGRVKDYEVVDGISRSQLVAMDVKEQRAVMKNASPETRAKLWSDKLKDTYKNARLSRDEKKAVKELCKLITPAAFGDGEEARSFQQKSVGFESEMKEKFGWDDNKLFILGGTVMTLEEFFAKYEKTLPEVNKADYL